MPIYLFTSLSFGSVAILNETSRRGEERRKGRRGKTSMRERGRGEGMSMRADQGYTRTPPLRHPSTVFICACAQRARTHTLVLGTNHSLSRPRNAQRVLHPRKLTAPIGFPLITFKRILFGKARLEETEWLGILSSTTLEDISLQDFITFF